MAALVCDAAYRDYVKFIQWVLNKPMTSTALILLDGRFLADHPHEKELLNSPLFKYRRTLLENLINCAHDFVFEVFSNKARLQYAKSRRYGCKIAIMMNALRSIAESKGPAEHRSLASGVLYILEGFTPTKL